MVWSLTSITRKSQIIVYVQLFFWRKNSILYSLIRVCMIINFWRWPSYTMLIWACTIIGIQQFFCLLKSRCIKSRKLKIKLMKSQKNEANFADFRWFCSFFCFQSPHWFFYFYYLLCTISYFSTLYYYSVLYYYWLFEILPPYTIISPYTIINFVDLSTLYHYFALYYYSGLQSIIPWSLEMTKEKQQDFGWA